MMASSPGDSPLRLMRIISPPSWLESVISSLLSQATGSLYCRTSESPATSGSSSTLSKTGVVLITAAAERADN